MYNHLPWQHANPFTQEWTIDASHLDHYNHVNNVAYLSKLESLAWAHSNALGLQFSNYQELDRGMVIRRHELNYHLPCHLDDTLVCATWIVGCDDKLSLTREFQYICARREQTVFTAKTEFICVSLSSGMPKRMPPLFREVYGNACLSV